MDILDGDIGGGGDGRVVRLRPSARRVIRGHAGAVPAEECCGALLGRSGTGGLAGDVVRAVPLRNEAAERRRRYEVGPARVRRLEAEAAVAGLEVVGFYHSHPTGPATPSRADTEGAWPWYVYLIAGADGLRAWRLSEDRMEFREVRVEPVMATAGGEAGH